MCMRISKIRHKKKESNWPSELYLVKIHRNFLFIIATDLGRQTFLFILHTNTVKTGTHIQRRIFLCVSVRIFCLNFFQFGHIVVLISYVIHTHVVQIVLI